MDASINEKPEHTTTVRSIAKQRQPNHRAHQKKPHTQFSLPRIP